MEVKKSTISTIFRQLQSVPVELQMLVFVVSRGEALSGLSA